MSVLALVGRLDDIPRPGIGLNNFLLFMSQHDPVMSAEMLLGIWLDPHMVVDTPDVLVVANQRVDQDIHIRETAGLQGIWTICWLGAADEKDGDAICRLLLLKSLIEHPSARKHEPPSGRFIPVFPSRTSESELKNEMGRLGAQNSHYLMPAWFQDAATGRLFQPDVDDAAPEPRWNQEQ
jgi:hypothetical protein